jgi:hypothetical protein
MACLANDLFDAGQTVVAAFSAHPHWDHVLWHAKLGSAPRYGTARCVAAIRDEMSGPHWKDSIAAWIPPEIVERMSWDLFGLINGLPAEAASNRTARTCRPCETPMFPSIRGSAPRPRTAGTGWPACMNGNYSSSPEEASAAARRVRDPLVTQLAYLLIRSFVCADEQLCPHARAGERAGTSPEVQRMPGERSGAPMLHAATTAGRSAAPAISVREAMPIRTSQSR